MGPKAFERNLRMKPSNSKNLIWIAILLSAVSCSKKQGDPSAQSGPAQGTASAQLTAGAAQLVHTGKGLKSAGGEIQAQLQAETQPQPACYTTAFRPSSKNGAHTHHDQNLIRLNAEGINAKSVCVRIDGTPVRHKLLPPQKAKAGLAVLIGSIPNPNSRVTARYCTFKATCAEDCTIPRDEFMEAIAGSDEETLLKRVQGKQAKWDPEDAEKDEDATAELGAEIERELAGSKTNEIFEGWVAETPSNGCGVKKANRD